MKADKSWWIGRSWMVQWIGGLEEIQEEEGLDWWSKQVGKTCVVGLYDPGL